MQTLDKRNSGEMYSKEQILKDFRRKDTEIFVVTHTLFPPKIMIFNFE